MSEEKNPRWSDIRVGDYIRVKVLSRHRHNIVKRKVTHAKPYGITLDGWRPFWLNKRLDKLVEIIKQKK